MLVWVTKMNTFDRKVLIVTENVCWVDQASNDYDTGSEIHFRNGSIIRVKECLNDVYDIMRGYPVTLDTTEKKEKQHSLAPKKQTSKRTPKNRQRQTPSP